MLAPAYPCSRSRRVSVKARRGESPPNGGIKSGGNRHPYSFPTGSSNMAGAERLNVRHDYRRNHGIWLTRKRVIVFQDTLPWGVLFFRQRPFTSSMANCSSRAGIMAVVADTHGFSNLLPGKAVIEGQKIIFRSERSHTQRMRRILLQSRDECRHGHIIAAG